MQSQMKTTQASQSVKVDLHNQKTQASMGPPQIKASSGSGKSTHNQKGILVDTKSNG